MPDDAPLVSVVIPTYNRAHVVGEALESVFRQSYPRIEVIVVDDGSTDDTPRVLEAYRDRIVCIRKENGGISSARNAGMRAARGEYVAWLDSDDLWTPDKTAIQAALMEARPDVILVSSDFSAFDDTGPLEASHIASYYSVIGRTPGGLAGLYTESHLFDGGSRPWWPAGTAPVGILSGFVYERLVWGSFIHPPTVMIRRSAALQTEGLDENLANSMEYEYFLRLSRLGRIAYVDRPLLRYRYSADQISSERHAVAMQTSILRIVQGIQRTDPGFARRNRKAFGRRLASCHVEAALALAETKPALAVRHLLRSLGLLYWDTKALRALARLSLPAWALRLYRRRGRRSG